MIDNRQEIADWNGRDRAVMTENAVRSPFGFEDLDVYRSARALQKELYKLAREMPVEERFALAVQLRKAAVSVTNNIAEGHGRYNWQDSTTFCRNARGSSVKQPTTSIPVWIRGTPTQSVFCPSRPTRARQ